MWPKILMQLFELLPHVSRLVPVADRYLSSRAANETANEEAFAAMAEGVRGDLGQVAKAHAGLYRQLQEQGNQIAELAENVRQARSQSEQTERRMAAVDAKIKSLDIWIKAGVVLIALLVVLVLVLLLRGHWQA
jgi:chromosome segregation ATPase